MPNEYYNKTGNPANKASGTSSTIRTEFDAIEAGFLKCPTLLGHANEVLAVKADETVITTKSTAQLGTDMGAEITTNKGISGGYAGLSGFRLIIKNLLGTVSSYLTNSATAVRTWTLQDKSGTLQDMTDLDLKGDLANQTWTGTPAAPTAANTDDSTKIMTTAWQQLRHLFTNAASGSYTFPGGLVVNWGTWTPGAVAPAYTTLTFDTALDTAYQIIGFALWDSLNTTGDLGTWFSHLTATNARGYSYEAGLPHYYLAIGYKAEA